MITDSSIPTFFDISKNVQIMKIRYCPRYQIGKISHSLMRGKLPLPSLEGVECLRMMVEVGAAKLKKDYVTALRGECAQVPEQA